MQQDSLISVIVPVYNVEKYLSRCVDSILDQTYEKLEIILVDDGAKDSSGKICDEYAEKDSRIKVIHKENGGLSSARNTGIDAATGDYLAFVDSDDWIEQDMYEKMLGLVEKHGVKLVCAGRYDVDSETDQKTIGLCPPKEELISGQELARRIFIWDNIDSAAVDKLYHASLFQGIRYPLGVVCEDVPTTYRIALNTERVAMCPVPMYNYYHRPGSITSAAVSEKTFHFESHTVGIYEYIRENAPEILPEARYLRVRGLFNSVISIDLADAQTRKKFASQHKHACRELRKHLGFLLSAPYFGKQERVTDILLALEIYRPLRMLYHKFK